MIIHLIVRLIKKTLYKMSQYFFPKPYEPFGREINVKVDLYTYAIKADLKNVTEVDPSKIAAKSDLTISKAEIDQIDLDKLKIVPDDLSKLGNIVDNEVFKKNCM